MNKTPEEAKGHANLVNGLLEQWKTRAAGMGYKPKSVTYQKLRLEFILGALAYQIAQGGEGAATLSGLAFIASVGRSTDDLMIKGP